MLFEASVLKKCSGSAHVEARQEEKEENVDDLFIPAKLKTHTAPLPGYKSAVDACLCRGSVSLPVPPFENAPFPQSP